MRRIVPKYEGESGAPKDATKTTTSSSAKLWMKLSPFAKYLNSYSKRLTSSNAKPVDTKKDIDKPKIHKSEISIQLKTDTTANQTSTKTATVAPTAKATGTGTRAGTRAGARAATRAGPGTGTGAGRAGAGTAGTGTGTGTGTRTTRTRSGTRSGTRSETGAGTKTETGEGIEKETVVVIKRGFRSGSGHRSGTGAGGTGAGAGTGKRTGNETRTRTSSGTRSETGAGTKMETGAGTEKETVVLIKRGFRSGSRHRSGTGAGAGTGKGTVTETGTGNETRTRTSSGTRSETEDGTKTETGAGTEKETVVVIKRQFGSGGGHRSGTGAGTEAGTGTETETVRGSKNGSGNRSGSGSVDGTGSGSGHVTGSGTGTGTGSGTGIGSGNGLGTGTKTEAITKNTYNEQTESSEDIKQVINMESMPSSIPPPPPPPLPSNKPSKEVIKKPIQQELKANRANTATNQRPVQMSSFLDELKAKYTPKEYKPECSSIGRAAGLKTSSYIKEHASLIPEPPEKSHKVLMYATLSKASSQAKKAILANEKAQTETIIPVQVEGSINKNDPKVKKMVYGTLRNYLDAYTSQAKQIVNQDYDTIVPTIGVRARVKHIKSQGPPPPALSGNLPATRIKSEIGERRNEPPPCVQNAMMTKDKKPFTYTPGGIDLSEIKSPRMARRIERNANAPGVGEVPQSPQSPCQNRPLPPSALAAMQPALPVQVFPSGAPPPPPPPPMNAPPPPPALHSMPMKTGASNNGIYERPDMTQIIPENPMALLRKTPKIERKTFLDELNDMERKNKQPGEIHAAPAAHQPDLQQFTPPPQAPTRVNYPPQLNRQLSNNSSPQPYTPPTQPAIPRPQQTSPQIVQQPQQCAMGSPQSPPTKTSNVSIGSLYIPPINQQQQIQQQLSSPKPETPPSPPQRHPQSPSTPQSPIPKLNTAPKPWQNQQRKESLLPEWAQRHQQSPPKEDGVQPARIAVQPPHVIPTQMQPPPPRPGVEVVWVTQPEVYQHPGQVPQGQRCAPTNAQHHPEMSPASQQQYMQHEPKGTRIIPIQIEGQLSGANSPGTPDRNFNRQQSWTPSQSNSFKVLQKMTEDENNYDHTQVEYGPRSAQQFPSDRNKHGYQGTGPKGPHVRTVPIRMEDDRQPYVHPSQETVAEPKKYMGSAIPSRAFKMVQAMTSNSPGPGQSDL